MQDLLDDLVVAAVDAVIERRDEAGHLGKVRPVCVGRKPPVELDGLAPTQHTRGAVDGEQPDELLGDIPFVREGQPARVRQGELRMRRGAHARGRHEELRGHRERSLAPGAHELKRDGRAAVVVEREHRGGAVAPRIGRLEAHSEQLGLSRRDDADGGQDGKGGGQVGHLEEHRRVVVVSNRDRLEGGVAAVHRGEGEQGVREDPTRDELLSARREGVP